VPGPALFPRIMDKCRCVAVEGGHPFVDAVLGAQAIARGLRSE
jgi:hypothetical protein